MLRISYEMPPEIDSKTKAIILTRASDKQLETIATSLLVGEGLMNLTKLEITATTDLTNEGAEYIAKILRDLPNLTDLSINGTSQIKREGYQAIFDALRLSNLTRFGFLQYDNCPIENLISALSDSNTKLTHLDIFNTEVTEVKKFITALPSFHNLTGLDITGCGLDNEAVNTLTIALPASKLKAVAINTFSTHHDSGKARNQINNYTIKKFFGILPNCKLTKLVICDQLYIKDETIEDLATNLFKSRLLTELTFYQSSAITNEGAEILAVHLQSCHLTSLTIGHSCDIDDQGIAAMVNAFELRNQTNKLPITLYFPENTEISDELKARIKALKPEEQVASSEPPNFIQNTPIPSPINPVSNIGQQKAA
jgi:Ran GTPase-activating protein (RanGAP) involved in mRNA processing and transport